ncbi:hypothetical protein FAB82_15660 [Glycomyces buryatensis]|uniref:NmrA-like domain-containing protein n=1 Tax=Glycomyces buryatensis TaxID=2570927 RepID=A0A4S8QHH0_9ACTN|nr:hypothetical protein FAB82_15660 [Glycomyces buryatensis]
MALREDGHLGERYLLAGPEPISPRQQAKLIGEALGEPVEFIEQTRAEAFNVLSKAWTAEVADATLEVIGNPNEIERAASSEVERLTGRRGRTFAEWAERNAAAFR